jgi:hypothetical protein
MQEAQRYGDVLISLLPVAIKHQQGHDMDTYHIFLEEPGR